MRDIAAVSFTRRGRSTVDAGDFAPTPRKFARRAFAPVIALATERAETEGRLTTEARRGPGVHQRDVSETDIDRLTPEVPALRPALRGGHRTRDRGLKAERFGVHTRGR